MNLVYSVIVVAAALAGCCKEVRDWDDDKMLVLGAMYDHFNENHLQAEQTICITSAQIQAKTGIKDSARVNLLLKHGSR